MRLLFLIVIIFISSCTKPAYVKDKYFDQSIKDYKRDSDLKELVYKSLERAFVTHKDISGYELIKDKSRIYVTDEYQKYKTVFHNQEDWDETVSHLQSFQVPPSIGDVLFSVKSRSDLQIIANKTKEDFLYGSITLIKIEENKAIVTVNNGWITSKLSNNVYLSGGGYTCTYKKIEGTWVFNEIINSWSS